MMTWRRSLTVGLAGVLAVSAGALALVQPAAADGTTPVALTCSGIPIVGSLAGSANVVATDDVDPVVVGGTVVNTLQVPVPVDNVPIAVTITEVKIAVPIPAGVSVSGVTFTPSSFSNQTAVVSGGNVVATLTGSVPVGGGAATPTVPDVKVTTTVAGPPRTVQWKVPSTITAKGNAGFLGNFTASCTPDNKELVLISTVVKAPNAAPTATDATVPVSYQTAKAVTLAGTDPNGDPLTFAVASQPSHGGLSGTAPNLTYTPDAGFSGTDSFTFTASDGSLQDTGTITLQVAGPNTPGAPTAVGAVAAEGEAKVSWTAPTSNGGSAITGYVITPIAAGVPGTPVEVGLVTSTVVEGLTNGVSHTFTVAARNAAGVGIASSASTAVTPQWWLPWSSANVAVTELFTWMTGKAPTTAELTSWLGLLNANTKLPGDLVADLRNGTDATKNVDPTIRLYAAYLTRIPDKGGLNFWLGRRRGGWTLSRISSSFAGSSEFITRYGTLTNRQFVEQIYLNVLGRPGEQSGIDYWTGQLDRKKKNRGQVMINFSESNEYKTAQVANVHAAAIYIHVLGKTPTVGQRDAFVAALASPGTLASVVRDLIHEPSFGDRAG